jgi:hypothetical protein
MAPLAVLHRKHIGWSAAGLALAALLLSGPAPAHAQYDPFHTPVIDSIIAAEDSIAAATAPPPDSTADKHALLRGLDALDGFLPLWLFEALLFLSFVVIPLVCAGGFAAVALFMDAGCLRIALAVLGWGSALLGGLLAGGLLGTMLGALSFFGWAGVITGGLGYPILFWRARTTVKQLPRAEYLTWKHTLMGGALVGTGTGSMLNVVRSAGVLFKGGGGSFGGGGASGTFGGGQVVQATAAVPGAAVPGVLEAGSASVSGVAASVAGGAAHCSRLQRWLRTSIQQLRRVRWYHGLAFGLILLIFLPVGAGVAAVLQTPNLLLGIALVATLLRAYWLLLRSGWFPQIAAALSLVVLFLTFGGMIFAAESQTPYTHLAITLAIAAVVQIGFFFLPASPAASASTSESPFQGGGASARW